MITELHLYGTELIVYAIIHGFTHNFMHFREDMKTLKLFTMDTEENILTAIASLYNNDLIDIQEHKYGKSIINIYLSKRS